MNTLKTLKRSKQAITDNIIALCNDAKQLEDAGEYVAAAGALEEWWQDIGVRPEVNDLPAGDKAAVLSRVGALSGWLGSTQQIPDSQEKAKDLISEAANLFEAIDDRQSWAETRSDLAVCYWREGAFDEARVILDDVLESDLKLSAELHGKILLRSVNVEISTRRYEKALYTINRAAPFIENTGSDLLRGKFYFHRALILRSVAENENNHRYFISAIADYGFARIYYEKARHNRYAAMAENNLGNVYRLLEDFPKAHLHLDSALQAYVKLKDKGRAALVYDNKARTFIAEGSLSDAELAAMTSVNMLREGGENATLAESLTTLGVVMSRGGNLTEAIHSFVEAKEIALMVGDTESAGNAVLTQIEELQSDLTPMVFRSLYLEADGLLKNSPKLSTISRLQKIARKHFEINEKVELTINWENFSLPEAIRLYEGEIILKALNETSGRVTKAAQLLGVSHQNLSGILHQRHKELKDYCVKRKPRHESKVKTH
jgi:tetratricopeptide (TPR) repeat protein